jgi:hypothetical protein
VLSRDDATALVAGSRLFDERWYAAVSGQSFDSRGEAAASWVTAPGDGSPHPLFEPLWLYPGGAWRRHAPDPLSYYVSQAAAGVRPPRAPHPRYDHELGPLEDWLVDHDPHDLLPAPLPRAVDEATAEVRVPTDDVRRAVRWLRHLHRTAPEVRVVALTDRTDVRRILDAVALDQPRVVVGDWSMSWGTPVVSIDPDLEPPRWRWLPPLLAALDRPGVAAAQPVLLDGSFLVAAPVLRGHPVSAIEALDGVVLPDRFAGIEARLPHTDGSSVLVTSSWVVGVGVDVGSTSQEAWAALERRARTVGVIEGAPSLRWSIDIAAGAAPIGRRWGDWHFASSLAAALRRLGQWVEIDHPETRGRATRSETDVVLTLRGLERVPPAPGAVNLLWVISHPEGVTTEELAGFDRAFAASTTWAARHGATPLLQCTDATRFRPGAGVTDSGAGVLFVGNARGGMRPVVAAAREAGIGVTVIGTGWADHGVASASDRIANEDLPAAYASAGVVLNDHHVDMAAEGFVSNRVFDVLAVGGRLLTDPVAGLSDVLAEVGASSQPTWQGADDLAGLARPPYDAWPDEHERRTVAERVVAAHSFDARAATLLDAAVTRLASTRSRSST